MKLLSNITSKVFLAAIALSGSLVLSSCSKVNDIPPVSTPVFRVTVKVIDHAAAGTVSPAKHLVITATIESQKILLDTTISGSYNFNFISPKPNVKVEAALTASTDFSSALEIDANGKMMAYHNSSCGDTEYSISDDISF